MAKRYLGFYSNLFIIPKPHEDIHLILNLKCLNKFPKVQTFHMKSILSCINRYKECISPCADSSSKSEVLAIFGRGSELQFLALPFGWATAPRILTKVLAPVLGVLRVQ